MHDRTRYNKAMVYLVGMSKDLKYTLQDGTRATHCKGRVGGWGTKTQLCSAAMQRAALALHC